jgi:AraC-like DNA-binding protein
MAQVVPLIRAAALVPFVHWLDANGRPTARRLAAADLAGLSLQDPERPVPFLNVGAFLRDMSRHEGPDIGCRVVSSASVRELATLGRVALGARTPGEALGRVAAVLQHHCTHEHITLERSERATVVRELFALSLDAETRHVIQQYVAALIGALCAMTGAAGPIFARVELAPHPRAGVAHLSGWLGSDVIAARGRALALWIDDAVMNAPFPAISRDRTGEQLPEEWQPLRGDGSFVASARAAMGFLLADRPPTLERLAAAAGTSIRTLQRRLGAENTTFSALLDDLRRTEASRVLAAPGPSIGDVAAMLGYAQQTSLTRAVRRWTGATPREQRRSEG